MLTLVCFGGLPGKVPPPRINDNSYSYKGKRQMARFKVSSLFLQAVAGRLDDHDLACGAAGFRQQARDRVCLIERQLTAARAETN